MTVRRNVGDGYCVRSTNSVCTPPSTTQKHSASHQMAAPVRQILSSPPAFAPAAPLKLLAAFHQKQPVLRQRLPALKPSFTEGEAAHAAVLILRPPLHEIALAS